MKRVRVSIVAVISIVIITTTPPITKTIGGPSTQQNQTTEVLNVKRIPTEDIFGEMGDIINTTSQVADIESALEEEPAWEEMDLTILDELYGSHDGVEVGDRGLLDIYHDIEVDTNPGNPKTDKNNLSREMNKKIQSMNIAEMKADSSLKNIEDRRREIAEVERLIEERRWNIFQKMVQTEVDRREEERRIQEARQTEVIASQGRGLSVLERNREIQLIAKAVGEGDMADKLIDIIPEYLGKPYIWGGDDNTTKGRGYDCSGFTLSVMNKLNKTIPRVSAMQYQRGTSITTNNLRAGDLVFFDTQDNFVVGRDTPTKVTHVGLYIGRGLMVHASSGSNRIRTEKVFSNYFAPRYMGARRYL